MLSKLLFVNTNYCVCMIWLLINTLMTEKYITLTGLSLHLGHFSITVEELFIIENDRNGFVFWYYITLTELFQYQVLH